ncbi:heat shock factor 2-binding protein-like [Littorina saxatilis]|uniref:Heat shock factor 2-binding protein n=1 Tax=Littorina saxatilis TaxID=31220 RepID=A0AAN9GFX1_9CAEN
MNPASTAIEKLLLTSEQVTKNFQLLLTEWGELKRSLHDSPLYYATPQIKPHEGEVTINRDTLTQLKTLTSRLQHTLPAVLRSGLSAATKAATLQQDVSAAQKQTAELAAESVQWKNKFTTASSDCQKEKQEVVELQKEVAHLWEQLNQQSDFSSSLGAATATLLWRVSRNQDTIAALLGGSKVEEFLGLTCSTVQSYVDAYQNDWPPPETNESRFILALCGTVTNIAASAYGRDFLMGSENGQRLIDAFFTFVSQAPLKKSAKIKSLMLMGLYNVSINQKGVQYLITKPGTLSLLAWHLKEETDVENRVNTLRLLQSIVAECDTNTPLRLLQPVPRPLLKTLSCDRNKQIKDLATELVTDLAAISAEP